MSIAVEPIRRASHVPPVPADWRDRVTITVPEAAAVLDIARNRAYESCRCGELPAIRLGARLLVPVAGLRRMLGEI